MSARVSLGALQKGAVRSSQRRKMVLDVDLNAPPCENCNEVGTSSQVPAIQLLPGQQGPPPQPVAIDVDSIDDDVLLSSPRAFAEAKNNLRRTRGRNQIVDVELVESAARIVTYNRSKRQRGGIHQSIINCELYVNLEASGVRGNGASGPHQSTSIMPPPPPPPPEPTFNCPVCMGTLVEEMSTKCGHIFCKACIKQAIATQSKCPTCRRKVTMKDTIRIYLPSTSLT